MDKLKLAATIVGLLGGLVVLIGGPTATITWLQDEFASNKALSEAQRKMFEIIIENQIESIEEDTEQDAQWAAYYRSEARTRSLTPSEAGRLEMLESNVVKKYKKSERYENVQMKLRSIDSEGSKE
jgi:uncharacterized membrane protein YgaE (UPF0421/DUF939 family)